MYYVMGTPKSGANSARIQPEHSVIFEQGS